MSALLVAHLQEDQSLVLAKELGIEWGAAAAAESQTTLVVHFYTRLAFNF